MVLIICAVLLLLFIIVAATYPSWGDAMKNTMLRITHVESDKAATEQYAEGCYQRALTCWAQRTGLNNGNLVYPPGIETDSYVATAGAACVNRYDPSERAFNLKSASADVQINLNREDISAQINHSIILKYIAARSSVSTFFQKIPVRYSYVKLLADKLARPGIERTADIDLLALEREPVEVHVYEVGTNTVVEIIDPASEIMPGVPFRWHLLKEGS